MDITQPPLLKLAALAAALVGTCAAVDAQIIDEDFQGVLYSNNLQLDNTPGASFPGWTFWKSGGTFPYPKARRSDAQGDFTGSTTTPNQGIQLEWASQSKAWNDTSHKWEAADKFSLSLNATPQSWNGQQQRFINVRIRQTSDNTLLWEGQSELPLYDGPGFDDDSNGTDDDFSAGNDWVDAQLFSWSIDASTFTAGTPGEAITLEIQSSGFRGLYFDNVLFELDGALIGDFDGDGDVDGVDIAEMFSNFNGPGGGAPTNPATDLDSDGDVDGVDIAALFGAFTGPSAPASVPEPTSLALLGLGVLLAARRRNAGT